MNLVRAIRLFEAPKAFRLWSTKPNAQSLKPLDSVEAIHLPLQHLDVRLSRTYPLYIPRLDVSLVQVFAVIVR